MKEHPLQVSIAQFLNLALKDRRTLWFAVPNGQLRSKAIAGKLKAEGVKPGVSDIIILHAGLFLGMEVKPATGRQSPDQKDWAVECEAAGGKYSVVRSINDVVEFLDANGVPLSARPSLTPGKLYDAA